MTSPSDACTRNPGHAGWLDCPTHGREIRDRVQRVARPAFPEQEAAVLAAYDQWARSVSEIISDRCALAFREGFLAADERLGIDMRAWKQRAETAENELAHATALVKQLRTAVHWNEQQRDIQAREIDRLRIAGHDHDPQTCGVCHG